LIVVGKHRTYLFKTQKISIDFHILDIIEVQSNTNTSVTIKTKKDLVIIEDAPENFVTDIISKIFFASVLTFPHTKDSFPLVISPEDRLKKIKSSIGDVSNFCGGFSSSYLSYCDYIGNQPCQDICWDIDNLYVFNDITEFNLLDLSMRHDRLTSVDWKCLIQALSHNNWFAAIKAEMVKPEKENLQQIAEIFQYNTTIQRMVLKDINVPPLFFSTLGTALSANPRCALRVLDFSGNQIESKEMISFASSLLSLKQGLVSLNFSKTGLVSKAILALAKTLDQHAPSASTLQSLSLGGCKLDSETCKALGSFFSKCSKLANLDLSQTNPDFHSLKRCECLVSLDVSGNKIITKDSKHLDFLHFLKLSPNIKELNISASNIPPEIIKSTLDELPSLQHLDISDNSLGDAGLISLISALQDKKLIKHLILNNNFDKKSKLRPQAIASLIGLVNDENSSIETLHLANSSKLSSLKEDIMPFIFCLMTNKKLKELDICGNQIGNSLALAIGKVLQTNRTLESLIWDDNNITFQGFQMLHSGLLKNSVLKNMPLPLNDITAILKEKQIPFLLELLKNIQEILFFNCAKSGQIQASSVSEEKVSVFKEVEKQVPSRPTRSYSKGNATEEKSSEKNNRTLRHTKLSDNLEIEAEETEKKKHPIKFKPRGIDTISAAQMFGQLNEVLKTRPESNQV
jgi:Ran GTPase-activating protein (RanGAP) involved in mRNA processing and transport